MIIKLVSLKENEDGSCNCVFDYDKDFENAVKKMYNRKRVSKKLMSKAILDGLKAGIEKL